MHAVTDSEREELARHCRKVIKKLRKGIVVPLLGAGVNLCDRPDNLTWRATDHLYLPNGRELAAHLAEELDAPLNLREREDLLRVAQFVDVTDGSGGLYRTLHDLFDADYEPGLVHRFLAGIAPDLREAGNGMPVILTTNYDDALERAFEDIGEPYDLITYISSSPREYRGRFMYWPPDGEPRVIEDPDEVKPALDKRTTILKLHGAVHRSGTFDQDNYVITEDHYIDYLTRTDITNLLPCGVVERLRMSHFLFLGYSMADWNLRVILHRIWGEQPLNFTSWAIQDKPDEMEQVVWRRRNVEIMKLDLKQYIKELDAAAAEARGAG